MQFNYVAYTLRDGVIKGNLDADNEAEARTEITRMGYKLLSVGAKWQAPGLETLFPSFFKVGTGELIRFARQLAIMVRGGAAACSGPLRCYRTKVATGLCAASLGMFKGR